MLKINLRSLTWMGILIAFYLVGCKGEFGTVGLEATDSPIDDPLYADVFLTIDEIKVEGKSIEDFERQTINISRLQNGLTESLFKSDVEEGEYESLTLVLDFDEDDQGNSPGCYANTSYDRKIDLANGRTGKEEIKVSNAFSLSPDQEINFVMDIDLRKSIRSSQPGDEDMLSLVSNSGIEEAIRIEEIANTGDLTGSLSLDGNIDSLTRYFVAYVYERGTFDKFTETLDSDGDGIIFENAISSSKVDLSQGQASQSFVLAFLAEGSYEVVFEAFERYEFSQLKKGFLVAQGYEVFPIPFEIKKGESTKLVLKGINVIP